jgi:hypothetical protein
MITVEQHDYHAMFLTKLYYLFFFRIIFRKLRDINFTERFSAVEFIFVAFVSF